MPRRINKHPKRKIRNTLDSAQQRRVVQNQSLIRIGLQFHHKNVRGVETETLLRVPLVSDQLVKEMCLTQPIFCEINQLGPIVQISIHTNSFETIEWRRSGRRIKSVPLTTPTTEASGIPSGDLFDPFLDPRLSCSELSFRYYVFHITSAARDMTIMFSHEKGGCLLLMYLSADIPKCNARLVSNCGAPWRTLGDDMENRHSGKGGRLVHSLEWVVAVRLLLVEPPGVPCASRV